MGQVQIKMVLYKLWGEILFIIFISYHLFIENSKGYTCPNNFSCRCYVLSMKRCTVPFLAKEGHTCMGHLHAGSSHFIN